MHISGDVQLDAKDEKFQIHDRGSGGSSTTKISRYFDERVVTGSTSLDFGKLKLVHESPVEVLSSLKHLDNQSGYKSTNDQRLLSQSEHIFVTPAISFEETKCRETSEEQASSIGRSEKAFDICLKETGTPKLKSPLHVLHREKRNEIKIPLGGQSASILRPGRVLLKNFIPRRDQAKIVETCRKLGLGNGGFYHPVYSNGVTVHSKLVCLGKNWDCETRLYDERRPGDGAEPPPIPSEFHKLVHKAIQDTQASLLNLYNLKNVESVRPSMTPNVCVSLV